MTEPADEFSAAFSSYAPAILRFAQRRLQDPDSAWDVVSDTFTAAWRNWQRRPGRADLLPWLYAIAGNAIRDQHRAAARRKRLVARLSAARHLRHVPDPAGDVALGQSVSSAMERLPAADREVLHLVGWEQLDDARAIGLVLGVSAATARVRVHRARRRLRALLDQADHPASPAKPARRTADRIPPAADPAVAAAPRSAQSRHSEA